MEWQNSMHALCANSPRCVCFSVEKSAINSRAHLYRLFSTLAFLLNLEFTRQKTFALNH